MFATGVPASPVDGVPFTGVIATFTDGKAEAYAARTLSAEDYFNYQAWTAYAEQCTRALDRETFPNAVVWPNQPAAYTPPVGLPVAPPTESAPEASADPA